MINKLVQIKGRLLIYFKLCETNIETFIITIISVSHKQELFKHIKITNA